MKCFPKKCLPKKFFSMKCLSRKFLQKLFFSEAVLFEVFPEEEAVLFDEVFPEEVFRSKFLSRCSFRCECLPPEEVSLRLGVRSTLPMKFLSMKCFPGSFKLNKSF